jgi:putative peptidoglycan lipid II flippase
VALVFEHGDFTAGDTAAVAEALRYHLPGLLFAAVDQLLIFAFYARKDTLTPALVGVGTTVLYAVVTIALSGLGLLTLPLLILVNSFKWAAHAVAMLVLTWRRLGSLRGQGIWGVIVRATLVSLAMAMCVWGTTELLGPVGSRGLLGELLIVGGAGAVGAAIYGLLALALGMEEIHLLRAALVDGIRRLTALKRPVIIAPPEETKDRE